MAIPPLTSVGTALPSLPTTKPAAAEGAGGGFGDMITQALQNVQATHTNADSLAQAAATGTATDVHDYMIAATQANLATELTVAVRNKAVEAFNDIMRMQI
jgi:flagellar hook-basal body complex protein FliE